MSRCTRFGLFPVLLGASALVVAGCATSTQGLQPDGAPSAPAVGSTVTPTPSASNPLAVSGPNAAQKQAALQAYEGMVNDWTSASLTANYKDPELSNYASGNALELITKALLTEQSKGVVSKGAPVVTAISYGQVVPADNPTEVVINSCFSDAAWLEYKASDGSLYNNVPGGNHRTQVLAADENGTWKIEQLAMNGVGTC